MQYIQDTSDSMEMFGKVWECLGTLILDTTGNVWESLGMFGNPDP
jgi:hypothetical protein